MSASALLLAEPAGLAATPLYLSRATLRRDTSARGLATLLVPRSGDERASASHRLVWSLFSDAEERERDFLWREQQPGQFLVLSRRVPLDPHRLFDIDHKPFAPRLVAGGRVGFALRCNATTTGPALADGRRGAVHDVVMHALHSVPSDDRGAVREELTQHAADTWLTRQGERSGFTPLDVRVDGYDTVQVPRPGRSARLGVLDLSGVLKVDDPTTFLERIAAGFGRGRAWGFGMMLLVPARAALPGSF